jgi:arginine/lysine/ornithine decarboxylase
MMQLGHGPFAEQIESLVDRVVRSYQSTSCSSLLLSSLDEARRHLAVNGAKAIGAALESVRAIRSEIRQSERFRDATPDIVRSEGTVDYDPFKVAIDMRGSGITGNDAQYLLIRDHKVYTELSTPSALLLLVGATSPVDVDRFLEALHALPQAETEPQRPDVMIPAACESAMQPTEAFFSKVELVSYLDAVGRVSADSLAAYPPGVPNVIPGEVLSEEVVNFLRSTAAAPSGYVRGAYDPALEQFRVVA